MYATAKGMRGPEVRATPALVGQPMMARAGLPTVDRAERATTVLEAPNTMGPAGRHMTVPAVLATEVQEVPPTMALEGLPILVQAVPATQALEGLATQGQEARETSVLQFANKTDSRVCHRVGSLDLPLNCGPARPSPTRRWRVTAAKEIRRHWNPKTSSSNCRKRGQSAYVNWWRATARR